MNVPRRVGWAVVCLAALAAAPARAEDDPPASATDTLAGESGVMVQTVCTNCNNADLSLGGLGNDFVPIACDDLPVTTGLPQIYLLSVMPSTLIDKIGVVRGACDPALDGAAVGGGIEIERHEPKPGLQLNVSADAGQFGWVGGRADVAGKRDWFGGAFAATYSESDTIDSNDDTNPDLPAFSRRTLEGYVEFTPGTRQRIRAGAAHYLEHQKDGPSAFDFLDYSVDPTIKYNLENVDLDRKQYDLVYEASAKDGSRFVVSGLFSKRDEDIYENFRWFQPVNIPTYTIVEEDTSAAFSWSRPIGSAWRVRAGASWLPRDYTVVDLLFNLFQGRPFDFALTENTTESGLWAAFEWAPSSALDINAGVRYADFEYEDNEYRPFMLALPLPEGNKVLPRLAVTWKPSQDWTLRTTAGLGLRQPEPTYDEVCCGRRYRNNRGIAMEESASYGIEAAWQPDPEVKIGASVYVTDFDDYILKLISSSFFYRPTYQNTNIAKARFSTLALDAKWQIAPWVEIRGSISWLDAENRAPDDAIPVSIDTGGSTLLSYTFHSDTIPYTFSRNAALGVVVRPVPAATLAVNGTYSGPMLIQQMTASGSSPVSGTLDAFYSTPSFGTLSVRYDHRIPKGVTLYAGVDNVTDFVETTLGKPAFSYTWGPLRGRYFYGGLSYRFGS